MALSTFNVMKHIETRDGALIALSEDQLRALQGVLTMMLRDMQHLCDRHGIAFFLGGGSCLGAVRHQGFIPWDDDIDLNMFRSDIDSFVEAIRSEYPDKYVVHTPWETHDMGVGALRVRLKGTVVRGHSDFLDEAGAFMDVFIIENVPDNRLLRAIHGFGSLALGLIVSCKRFSDHADNYLEIAGDNTEVIKTFKKKIALGRLFSFMTLDAWTRLWDRWNSACGNQSSMYVTGPAGRHHYFGEMNLRATYVPYKAGLFSGVQVNMPADVHTYLVSCYGNDYMIPPSSSDREVHVVKEFDLGKYAQMEEGEWR